MLNSCFLHWSKNRYGPFSVPCKSSFSSHVESFPKLFQCLQGWSKSDFQAQSLLKSFSVEKWPISNLLETSGYKENARGFYQRAETHRVPQVLGPPVDRSVQQMESQHLTTCLKLCWPQWTWCDYPCRSHSQQLPNGSFLLKKKTKRWHVTCSEHRCARASVKIHKA